MQDERPYDFALSLAGEDRALEKEVADHLRFFNCEVFYDDWQRSDLIGEDLHRYLAEIYENRARYCVVFVSENYRNKRWPKHERKFAFARDFLDEATYILPVRIDDTQITGIPETIGYLDARKLSPSQIAILLIRKMGASVYDGDSTDILLDKETHWGIHSNGDVDSAQKLRFLYLGHDPKEEHTFRVRSPSDNTLDLENLRSGNEGREFNTRILSQTRLSCEFAVELDPPLNFADTIEYDLSYRCVRYFENTKEFCVDDFRASIPIWRWHYDFTFQSSSQVDDFEAFRVVGEESIRVPCRIRRNDDETVCAVTLRKPKVGTLLKVHFRLS